MLVAGPLLLVVPGALGAMLHANEGVLTRLSVWNVPLRAPWLGFSHLPAVDFVSVGLFTALGLAGALALATRHDTDPARGAAVGVAGWIVAAGYVLAWYSALGLVVAALRPTDRIARWLAVQGGVITAAFLVPRASLTTVPLLGFTIRILVPLALAAGFAWAVARPVRRLWRGEARGRLLPAPA